MTTLPQDEPKARDILSNRPFRRRLPNRIFGRYAGFISRTIGILIDQVVIGLVAVGLFLVVRSILRLAGMNIDTCTQFVPLEDFSDLFKNVCRTARGGTYFASIIFGPVYYIALWTLTGQTIGMAMAGIRVVQSNGRHITLRASLVRMIGFIICVLSLGLGFLRVNWDDKRQGWHDEMARSYVIYTWKHVPVPPLAQPVRPIPAQDDD